MEYIIEELQLFLRNRQFAIENNPYVFEIVLGQKAKVVCLQDKLRKMISDERNTLDKEELR